MTDQAFSDMLIHTCDVYRRSLDDTDIDKWGDSAETIAVSSSSVACLFQSRDESLAFTVRGEKVMSREVVFFEFTADIEEDDILLYDSKKYLVLGVDNAAGQSHHKECSVIPLNN